MVGHQFISSLHRTIVKLAIKFYIFQEILGFIKNVLRQIIRLSRHLAKIYVYRLKKEDLDRLDNSIYIKIN